MSIPVSCDGVKTHVFMDDSIEFLRKYPGGVFSCDEGEGNAFVDDLVVSIQPIDIRGVIFRWIIRPNVV